MNKKVRWTYINLLKYGGSVIKFQDGTALAIDFKSGRRWLDYTIDEHKFILDFNNLQPNDQKY